jgi:hypothetical protein
MELQTTSNSKESNTMTGTRSEVTQTAQNAPKKAAAKKGATPSRNAPRAKQGAKEAKPRKPAKAAKKAAKQIAPKKPKAAKAEPRDGSKSAKVLGLLRRPEGATLDEIMKTTKWQAHSVRGFIAILKRSGHKVESTISEAGERTYRIAK